MGRRKTEEPKAADNTEALEVENEELDNDEADEIEAAALEEEAPAPKPRRSRPRKRKAASAETEGEVAAASSSEPASQDPAIVPSPLNISTAIYGVKPTRARRAPKPKAPVAAEAPIDTASVPVAAPAHVTNEAASISASVPAPIEPAQPPPAPAVATVIAEPIPGDDLSVARASIEKSMDSMVQGWGSVKQISSTICQDLERVTKLLTEQTALHAPVAKPSPLNRWAIAASAVAVILSLLSLSLSQTARQDIASHDVPARFSHNPDLPLEPLTVTRHETPRADPLGLIGPVPHSAPTSLAKTPRRASPAVATTTSRGVRAPITAHRMKAANVEMVLRRPVLLAMAERERHSHARHTAKRAEKVKALR